MAPLPQAGRPWCCDNEDPCAVLLSDQRITYCCPWLHRDRGSRGRSHHPRHAEGQTDCEPGLWASLPLASESGTARVCYGLMFVIVMSKPWDQMVSGFSQQGTSICIEKKTFWWLYRKGNNRGYYSLGRAFQDTCFLLYTFTIWFFCNGHALILWTEERNIFNNDLKICKNIIGLKRWTLEPRNRLYMTQANHIVQRLSQRLGLTMLTSCSDWPS